MPCLIYEIDSRVGTISLLYSGVRDVPEETVDELLYTLLTTLALDAVTANHVRDISESHESDKTFYGRPSVDRPLPILPRSRCTELRELRLHWDHLSLRRLSTLLHLPKRLEVLHLLFSSSQRLNYHGSINRYSNKKAAMHLNSALRPVAHSLRELTICLTDDESDP